MPARRGRSVRSRRATAALVAPAVLALLAGCGEPVAIPVRSASAPRATAAPPRDGAATPAAAPDAGACTPVDPASSPPPCDASVLVFEAGREVRRVCAAEARRDALTVVDLSDDWVPLALREPEGDDAPPQPYRATYVGLANEEFPPGPDGDRPRRDAFLELYGIAPSLRVAAGRLLDEERHRCAAAVDMEPVRALTTSPQPSAVSRAVRVRPEVESAFAALDQRLVCEGLLPATSRRRPRWRLQEALEAFQRKHTIVSYGVLDRETRRAVAEDSRELDFRTALRVLRARVVDATGLIEDGTAAGVRGEILSRRIDGDAFYPADESDAVDGGAPDLISPATEAAATALGWMDPDATADFFRRRGPDGTRRLVVALRLPAVPAYHSEHMALAVEIDRGDVWYELPARRGKIAHHPTLTLYASAPDGGDVALVHWPTTIGGWKKERGSGGRIGLRYKNSDVGTRLWRDLVVSPAWLPPPQTPARALVQRVSGPKRWLPDTILVGPGYASAYGLVMLVHHRRAGNADGEVWYDNGIRTHGSVSYHSIVGSESHGCHRLFNHAALELASFLLRHRHHVVHGVLAKPFTHQFTWRGLTLKLPIPYRGFGFELTPPVQVDVLQGTVRGRIHRVPHRLVRLTRPGAVAQAPGAPGAPTAAH